jgi:Zn-dependent M28 family amino/carboxypeptidase
MNHYRFPHRLIGWLVIAIAAFVASPEPSAQTAVAVAERTNGSRLFDEDDLRTWLTTLSSDAMQGRAVFTEGYGLAASYVAGELRALGVKPMGDKGSYFQAVARTAYNVERQSSLTVIVGGETHTFVDGNHVSFPADTGSKQTLSFSGVEFVGSGPLLEAGALQRLDRDVTGRLVIYMMPTATPAGRGRGRAGSMAARTAFLLEVERAAGVLAVNPAPPQPAGRAAGPSAARNSTMTTVLALDRPKAPTVTVDDAVLDLLLKKSPASLADLQARAAAGESLPMFTIADAAVTIDLASRYQPTNVQLTQNVVGMVEGTDPVLKESYVFLGAHLDHVGYSSGSEPKGRANVPVEQDRIWNGADDDGSGSTALLALAKAFMKGPKPKRSIVFVWHAGEEVGLLGSQFMAERPVVPLERIQVQLNIDMIGRNRDDDPKQANTLYLIGADRISTDLHNLLVDVNARQADPLTLDYEFNGADDPNRFYERSDHYSYASKGIPVAFFFTGEHPDYHANTDTVDKIIFPKMLRVIEFVHAATLRLADSETPLRRDNRGSRSGKGFAGTLE